MSSSEANSAYVPSGVKSANKHARALTAHDAACCQNSLNAGSGILSYRPVPSLSSDDFQASTNTDPDSIAALHERAKANLAELLDAIDPSPDSRNHTRSHGQLAFVEADVMWRAAQDSCACYDQQSLAALQMSQKAVKATSTELREHASLAQARHPRGSVSIQIN
jgi:hypothetical protein